MTAPTTTEVATAFKVGDKVRVVRDHPLQPFQGTVTDVSDGPTGKPVYSVRHVDNEPEYHQFIANELVDATLADFLDQRDIKALKRELLYNATSEEFPEFGIDSPRAHERIVTYNRIAWLASRLAWLETVDLPHFHDRD